MVKAEGLHDVITCVTSWFSFCNLKGVSILSPVFCCSVFNKNGTDELINFITRRQQLETQREQLKLRCD
ncbi:hypothetical protein QQF64_013193 [Cirrhinus molitorella]|uniref:Uncharacterized protein n=1 Tax=Cirrhinus molitorella TaxID=172907 RepID=A0ABR3LU27_9TELE